MNVVWAYLKSLIVLYLLPKVTWVVLVIYSLTLMQVKNVFSLIKHNKTPDRSSLSINGTLSSMIQVKLANSDTFVKWEPPKPLLAVAA